MKRRFLSFCLAALMMLSSSAVAADEYMIPVKLTADAPTFSVTLPTSIPIALGSNGLVTCPSDLKIINNSAGPIQIISIKMTEDTDSGWKLTDFNGGDREKLAGEKINSKKLGFGLTANGDTAATAIDGPQLLNYTDDSWTIPGGNNVELPISCQAISSAVTTATTNEAAGSVIFTVGWKGTVTSYTIRPLEDVMDEEGNVSVVVGDRVQLTAAATYGLSVPTWMSSNPSVVEVTSDGWATAVGAGDADITYSMRGIESTIPFHVEKKILWLYKNGDECSDVTGGWNECYVHDSGYTGTYTSTRNNNNIELYLYKYGSNMIATSNKIKANGALKVKYDVWSTTGASSPSVVVRFGVFSSLPDNQTAFRSGGTGKGYETSATDEIASLDISTSGYVVVGIDSGSAITKMNIRIKEVWIE